MLSLQVKEFEEILQDKYYDTHDHHLLRMVKLLNYLRKVIS